MSLSDAKKEISGLAGDKSKVDELVKTSWLNYRKRSLNSAIRAISFSFARLEAVEMVESDIKYLTKSEKTLIHHKVDPLSGKHKELWQELFKHYCKYFKTFGPKWKALWYGGLSSSGEIELEFRQEDINTFLQPSQSSDNAYSPAEVFLQTALLGLADCEKGFLTLLPNIQEIEKHDLAYYVALSKAIHTGDLTDIAVVLRKYRTKLVGEKCLHFLYIVLSSSQAKFQSNMPKPMSILKRYDSPEKGQFMLCCRRIERVLADSSSLQIKLSKISEHLMGLESDLSPFENILVTARISRWLIKSNKKELAKITIAQYQDYCLQLSFGRNKDVFDLFNEHQQIPRPERHLEAVSLSGFGNSYDVNSKFFNARFSVFSKALIKNGFLGLIKKQNTNQIAVETLIDIASDSDQFKGAVIKFVQFLHAMGISYSENMQSKIQNLVYATAPLNEEGIQAHYKRHANDALKSEIEAPSTKVLGTGGISQVVEATLKDGSAVAIKIAYPNISDLIEKDFNSAAKIVGYLPVKNGPAYRTVLEAFKTGMLAEADLSIEQQTQSNFREKYKDHPYIKIPKVYAEYSNSHLLVMEKATGERISDVRNSAPQELLDHYAEIIFDWSASNTFESNCFIYDRFENNFLIEGENIWAMDFGAAGYLPSSEMKQWRRFFAALVNNDESMAVDAFSTLYDQPNSGFDVSRVVRNRLDALSPIFGKDEAVVLSPSFLAQDLQRSMAIPNLMEMVQNCPDLIRSMQNLWNCLRITSVTGGKANFHKLSKSIIDRYGY